MTQRLKSIATLLLVFICANNLNAQIVEMDSSSTPASAEEFLPIAGGTPFSDVRYLEAQGNPYFSFDWENSIIVTKDGKAYKDVPVRIDLVVNRVQYKTGDGSTKLISAPLKVITLLPNGKKVNFIQGDELPNKKTGWFQLLVNDSISLVKSFRKTFEEKPSYGSNQLSINTSEFYFAYFNKTEFQVKKASDLLAILPERKAEVEAEIKRSKSLSKEEQLVAVVSYLNSLVKK